jgi:hypothetical protein
MMKLDEYGVHVQAVEAKRDGLIAKAAELQAETFRRLEAAGVTRSTVAAVARSLGSPPREVPFSRILAALADRLEAQAEIARALALEWRGWDGQLAELAAEGEARALSLAMEPGRPC